MGGGGGHLHGDSPIVDRPVDGLQCVYFFGLYQPKPLGARIHYCESVFRRYLILVVQFATDYGERLHEQGLGRLC